jgi:hypothetical protein
MRDLRAANLFFSSPSTKTRFAATQIMRELSNEEENEEQLFDLFEPEKHS